METLKAFVACLLVVAAPLQVRSGAVRYPGGAATGVLLNTTDFTCTGTFLSPYINTGSYVAAPNTPVAMRYESGARHYFVLDGSAAHISEFAEPGSLSPCSTAPASVVRASYEGWGGDWGAWPGGNAAPGVASTNMSMSAGIAGSVLAQGMTWDPVTSELILSWGLQYSGAPLTGSNAFSAVTLPSQGSMSIVGCWGVTNVPQPRLASGVLLIPTSFVNANLPAGARWGVGTGSYNALVGSSPSQGPTIYAVVPPATNSCPTNTDALVSGTKLEDHPININGPSCIGSGHPGCGATTPAPASPYAAQVALTNYSMAVYNTDWEVGGTGHGWYTFGGGTRLGWYDDRPLGGDKYGVVAFGNFSEGWANTTVSSSSSTTAMVVASTSTHDSLNMNPGDRLWVQTCTIGTDGPGCVANNGNNASIVQVSTVNTGTGAITFTINTSDGGTGNHFPVVGGFVYAGCIYFWGSPTCSRTEMRAQIFDPAQYSAVIGGMDGSTVTAAHDAEVDTTLITNLGSPSSGQGIAAAPPGGGGGNYVNAVIPDPTNHNIIVMTGGAPTGGSGGVSLEGYILHITEPAPLPFGVLTLPLALLVARRGRR